MPRKTTNTQKPAIQEIRLNPEMAIVILVFAHKGRARTYQYVNGDWYICQSDSYTKLPETVAVRDLLDEQLPKLEVTS